MRGNGSPRAEVRTNLGIASQGVALGCFVWARSGHRHDDAVPGFRPEGPATCKSRATPCVLPTAVQPRSHAPAWECRLRRSASHAFGRLPVGCHIDQRLHPGVIPGAGIPPVSRITSLARFSAEAMKWIWFSRTKYSRRTGDCDPGGTSWSSAGSGRCRAG
jgi:hypothetical protein